MIVVIKAVRVLMLVSFIMDCGNPKPKQAQEVIVPNWSMTNKWNLWCM